MLKLRSSEIPAEELPEHIALLRGCSDDVTALLDSLGARLESETPRSRLQLLTGMRLQNLTPESGATSRKRSGSPSGTTGATPRHCAFRKTSTGFSFVRAR